MCQCNSCGRKFEKGSEGDNETLCLRCERQQILEDVEMDGYEDLDLEETNRARHGQE